MDVMTLNYNTGSGRGCMTINMAQMFPCTKTVLRKILKVIDMTDEPELHRADLIIFFNEKLDAAMNERDRKVLANRHVDYMTKAVELGPEIDNLEKQLKASQEYCKLHVRRGDKDNAYIKQRDGLKDKIKAKKEERRHYQNIAASSKRMFEELVADEGKYKELLKELGQEAEDGSTEG